MTNRKLLILDYVEQFECIGPVCEDLCCHGWKVGIDRDTYDRYVNHSDSTFAQKAREVLEPPTEESTVEQYSFIRMLPSGYCPFLRNDMMCSIQAQFGEGMLSPVCSTYPREDSMVNGLRERSCSTSCPEAARLVLLRRQGMQPVLTELPERVGDYLYHRHLEFDELKAHESYKRHFWHLRVSTLKVLQNRNLTIQNRLISLGLMVSRLERAIDSGAEESIPSMLQEFDADLQNGALKSEIEKLPAHPQRQFEFLSALTREDFIRGVNHKRFKECFGDFKQGLSMSTSKAGASEQWSRYVELFGMYGSAFINEHEFIFENHLVNLAFRTLFPCGPGSPQEQFALLAVQFTLIRAFLIGMSGVYNGLSVELCIKLIQSFGRNFENSPVFQENVLTLLQTHNLVSLAHMIILLKLE